MEDRDIYAAVIEAVRTRQRAALATVVRVKGSTPRHVGSKMLIGDAGALRGTIGGGCGEAEVLLAAEEVLETGIPRLVRVELTDDYLSWSPAICRPGRDLAKAAISAAVCGGSACAPLLFRSGSGVVVRARTRTARMPG